MGRPWAAPGRGGGIVPGRPASSLALQPKMRLGNLEEIRSRWAPRLIRYGPSMLRVGGLMMMVAFAITAIGALGFPELFEWPILAVAHGVGEYRYIVIPMAWVGAVLLGWGMAWMAWSRQERP